MKFKVKRRWWIWAIGILWNIMAVRFFQIGIYPFALVILIVDIAVIFPEIHVSYEITNRQFTVKRILFPDISFPCESITAVENATLITAWGGRSPVINMNQIVEGSLGAYKISYSTNKGNHKRKAVVVSAKDRQAFMGVLTKYIDKNVILTNNTESAFKKKKDDM